MSLSPDDWDALRPGALLDWDGIAGLVQQILRETVGPMLRQLADRCSWPQAEQAITGFALPEGEMDPRKTISTFLTDLLKAVEAAERGDVAELPAPEVIHAYRYPISPAGASDEDWMRRLIRHRLVQTLTRALDIEGALNALYTLWYIEAGADQPGSRQWRLAQAAKPAQ